MMGKLGFVDRRLGRASLTCRSFSSVGKQQQAPTRQPVVANGSSRLVVENAVARRGFLLGSVRSRATWFS